MQKILVGLLLCASFVYAGPAVLPPDVDHYRILGFQALYNMNYSEAQLEFERMTKIMPGHPAGYIYLASAVWLEHLANLRRLQTQLYNRNDAFFSSTGEIFDAQVDRKFQMYMSKGMTLCQSRLARNPHDLIGLYYLGVADGATAGYETTVKRKFFPSLKNGSKAVELHRKILESDPHFVDANLSVGMYEYVVGSLPLAVKILAFLGGVHGSKKEGLQKLEEVYRKGYYAKDEAAVILVLLYDREKRLEDSLAILKDLSQKYPSNFIFRIEMARTYARLRRFPDSFRTFNELIQNHPAMDYMADLIQYQYGQALFEAQQWDKARYLYVAASYCPKAPMSLITIARLEAGKCLDASGKRQMAKAEYEYVLKLPDAFESHDQARKYLKKAFMPENSGQKPPPSGTL